MQELELPRERPPARHAWGYAAAGLDGVARAASFLGLVGAVAALAVMFGYTIASVVGRYTGWFTILGADEIGSYALAGLFFLGLGHSFRANAFVRVGVLYSRLGGWRAPAADAVLGAIALGATVLLTIYAWRFIGQTRGFGTKSIGPSQVPLYVPQLSMGIGLAIWCLEVTAYCAACVLRFGTALRTPA